MTYYVSSPENYHQNAVTEQFNNLKVLQENDTGMDSYKSANRFNRLKITLSGFIRVDLFIIFITDGALSKAAHFSDENFRLRVQV